MSQFLGTHQSRLDAKGRVSVPAAFRAALRASGGEAAGGGVSMILRPSHQHDCIEAWPLAAFDALSAPLQTLPMFSDEHEDFAGTLYNDAQLVESDKEGRIMVPGGLLAHARISSELTFMGFGRIFQIWEPEASQRRAAEARERTKARRLSLGGASAAVTASPKGAPNAAPGAAPNPGASA